MRSSRDRLGLCAIHDDERARVGRSVEGSQLTVVCSQFHIAGLLCSCSEGVWRCIHVPTLSSVVNVHCTLLFCAPTVAINGPYFTCGYAIVIIVLLL